MARFYQETIMLYHSILMQSICDRCETCTSCRYGSGLQRGKVLVIEKEYSISLQSNLHGLQHITFQKGIWDQTQKQIMWTQAHIIPNRYMGSVSKANFADSSSLQFLKRYVVSKATYMDSCAWHSEKVYGISLISNLHGLQLIVF